MEWREVNKKKTQFPNGLRTNMQHLNQKWLAPITGTFKINVDASILEGENSFSVGMVLRNHQWHYVGGKTLSFPGRVSILETEMVGILKALIWTTELTVEVSKVEIDSLSSVNAINKLSMNYLELANLVK